MYGMGYGGAGYGMGGVCCPAPVAPVAAGCGVGAGDNCYFNLNSYRFRRNFLEITTI